MKGDKAVTQKEQTISEWLESTDRTIEALEEWRRKMEIWRRQGCDNGEFQAALFTLRSAGLEDWADRNPAGLDALAEAAAWPQGDLGSTDPYQDDGLLPKSCEGENCPTTSRPRGAWIDLKTINGCGPYAYLRWRENGRCRSKYLGKVEIR